MADNYKKIRELIENKTSSSSPVYATVNTNSETTTDKFAYPSWFRGDPTSSNPIIAEREAGWRPMSKSNYPAFMHVGGRTSAGYLKTPVIPQEEAALGTSDNPNQYFQTSCSTVFPYYPPDQKANQNLMFGKLNEDYTYMLSHR